MAGERRCLSLIDGNRGASLEMPSSNSKIMCAWLKPAHPGLSNV